MKLGAALSRVKIGVWGSCAIMIPTAEPAAQTHANCPIEPEGRRSIRTGRDEGTLQRQAADRGELRGCIVALDFVVAAIRDRKVQADGWLNHQPDRRGSIWIGRPTAGSSAVL